MGQIKSANRLPLRPESTSEPDPRERQGGGRWGIQDNGEYKTKRIRGELISGGAGGIRTLDRPLQAYNGLANRRLQPLGHSSMSADMPDAGASRKRQIGLRRSHLHARLRRAVANNPYRVFGGGFWSLAVVRRMCGRRNGVDVAPARSIRLFALRFQLLPATPAGIGRRNLIRGWIPVRVKTTRQNKDLERGFDSIRTEGALKAGCGLGSDALRPLHRLYYRRGIGRCGFAVRALDSILGACVAPSPTLVAVPRRIL